MFETDCAISVFIGVGKSWHVRKGSLGDWLHIYTFRHIMPSSEVTIKMYHLELTPKSYDIYKRT
jgi:hypothetical protein